jgi:hypothetical protein
LKFEVDAENYHFILNLTQDPNYLPDGQFDIFDPEDIEQQLGGYLSFYQLHIISHPIGKAETLTHYQPGILLPKDPDDLQEELGTLLDDNKYLEHIISHWELEDS